MSQPAERAGPGGGLQERKVDAPFGGVLVGARLMLWCFGTNAGHRRKSGGFQPHLLESRYIEELAGTPVRREQGFHLPLERRIAGAHPGIGPDPSPARPGRLIAGIYLFGGICKKPHLGVLTAPDSVHSPRPDPGDDRVPRAAPAPMLG